MTDDRERDLDQEWEELLSEVRIILPGILVLFAFLLTVPFSNQFREVPGRDRTLYFVAFLASAVASAVLMTPSMYHRLLWRTHDKEHVLRMSNRYTLIGGGCAAVAIAAVVYFVSDFLYEDVVSASATVAIVVLMGWLWYGQPLLRRRRR